MAVQAHTMRAVLTAACCCCLGLAATVGRSRYTAQRAQREVERVSRETQRATWRESSVRERPQP